MKKTPRGGQGPKLADAALERDVDREQCYLRRPAFFFDSSAESAIVAVTLSTGRTVPAGEGRRRAAPKAIRRRPPPTPPREPPRSRRDWVETPGQAKVIRPRQSRRSEPLADRPLCRRAASGRCSFHLLHGLARRDDLRIGLRLPPCSPRTPGSTWHPRLRGMSDHDVRTGHVADDSLLFDPWPSPTDHADKHCTRFFGGPIAMAVDCAYVDGCFRSKPRKAECLFPRIMIDNLSN